MSEYQNPDLEKMIRRIPNVDSPKHLDDKILSEARRLAPDRKTFLENLISIGWMRLSATVCMVGLAVVVARPVIIHLQSTPQDLSIQTMGQSDTAKKLGTAKISSADAPLESRVQNQQQIDEIVVFKSDSDDAIIQSESDGLNQQKKAKQETTLQDAATQESTQEFNLSQPIAIAPESIELEALTESSENSEEKQVATESESLLKPESDSIVTEEQTVVNSLAGSTVKEIESRSEVAMPRMSDFELQKWLEDIKKLVDENKLDIAKSKLAELKLRCPECDVPESIEGL